MWKYNDEHQNALVFEFHDWSLANQFNTYFIDVEITSTYLVTAHLDRVLQRLLLPHSSPVQYFSGKPNNTIV